MLAARADPGGLGLVRFREQGRLVAREQRELALDEVVERAAAEPQSSSS
jgi:hypothetical protein